MCTYTSICLIDVWLHWCGMHLITLYCKLFVFNEAICLSESFSLHFPEIPKTWFFSTCIALSTFWIVSVENFPFSHEGSYCISSSSLTTFSMLFHQPPPALLLCRLLFSPLHSPLDSSCPYLFQSSSQQRCEDTSGPAANWVHLC